MDVDDVISDNVADHACASCKKNKRRCDKGLPRCSLCLKTDRFCDYSDSPQYSHAEELGELRSRVRELEERVLASSRQTPSSSSGEVVARYPDTNRGGFPSLSVQACFLDADLWSSSNIPDQARQVLVPESVSMLLGNHFDVENIKSQYFKSIHTWMPIISKIRLNRLTQPTQGVLKADLALLLLCMKLAQEVPDSQEGPSDLYTAVKKFSTELELKGLLTLRTIQTGLLLSVYEVGHAIFPAAFTSISHCARQGVALGLHSKLAPPLAGKPRGWVDWEERQRVWWMVVILDRYVTVGSDYRPLSAEDPSKDTMLPADDNAWDNGEMVSPERVSLSSQTTNAVSPFARLAQASNLLGRVIRHCNDPTLELKFVLDDYEMLCQTIYSLTELLSADDSTSAMELSIANTICFSALFKLTNHHSCDMFNEESQYLDPSSAPRVRETMQQCLTMTREICSRVVSLAQDLGHRLAHSDMERVSPLMLHCIYSCASNLSWMALETGNGRYVEGSRVCADLLGEVGRRWRVAGVYLELLRVGEAQDEGS